MLFEHKIKSICGREAPHYEHIMQQFLLSHPQTFLSIMPLHPVKLFLGIQYSLCNIHICLHLKLLALKTTILCVYLINLLPYMVNKGTYLSAVITPESSDQSYKSAILPSRSTTS
eukprot:sb/3476798/